MSCNQKKEIPLPPYVTFKEGIKGKIKHLPEDFIVAEIIEKNHILDPRASNFDLPSQKGLFIHGVLIKNNVDMETALSILANSFNIQREYIGYAGIKDKRALTAQRVSIWGVAKRFRGKNSLDFETANIKLKGTVQSLHEIRLGDLLGNFFEITLRDISIDQETIFHRIKEIFTEIETFGGIINGFDLQRFGDKRPISHVIGKLLLLNKHQEAVKFYVGKTFRNENQEEWLARNCYWETEDVKETLKLLPTNLRFERKLLLYLLSHPNDYKRCFNAISRQFEKFFIHAYQAYLFNMYLNERYRISKNFNTPIEGEKKVNNRVLAPMLGAKIKVEGLVKDIYEDILQKENIAFKNFQQSEVAKIGGRGVYRQILTLPKEFRIVSVLKDELHSPNNKVIIAFKLQKGSYATLVLREITKNL